MVNTSWSVIWMVHLGGCDKLKYMVKRQMDSWKLDLKQSFNILCDYKNKVIY